MRLPLAAAAIVLAACTGGGGGLECNGTHPIVDGGARYCAPGQCYCASPDSCFAPDRAAACCTGTVMCTPTSSADTGTDTGSPPIDAASCDGTHPIVGAGGERTCDAGRCFCADPDACFPTAVAASCCTVDVVCGG